jgi:hypothetical protein
LEAVQWVADSSAVDWWEVGWLAVDSSAADWLVADSSEAGLWAVDWWVQSCSSAVEGYWSLGGVYW